MDITQIKFSKPLPPEIFNKTAEEAAKEISNGGNKNKSTQLRRFYDELVMFNDRIPQGTPEKKDERFREMEPFIKMLNAKAAYAKGRNLVDDKFVNIFSQCINQITDYESLRHCKLFMEAMIGFRKAKE